MVHGAQQSPHLIGSHVLPDAHGAVTGHARQDRVARLVQTAGAPDLDQILGEIAQQGRRVGIAEQCRYGAHGEGVAGVRLDLEADLAEAAEVLTQQRRLARTEVDHLGDQQALARHHARPLRVAQALEHHPLVRRVLVDQHQLVIALTDEVAAEHLTEHAQRGEEAAPVAGARLHGGIELARRPTERTRRRRCIGRRAAVRFARPIARLQRQPSELAAAQRDLAEPGAGRSISSRVAGAPLRILRIEPLLDGRDQHVVNGPRAAEPYLRLGGMNVDVDLVVRNLDEHHRRRIPTVHEQRAVAGEQRVRDHLVAHVAPIHVREDLSLARKGRLRVADPAVHGDAATLVTESEQRPSPLGAQHLAHPLGGVFDRSVIEQRATVVGESEGDLRPRQRQPGQQLADVSDLGGGCSQELAPRRSVGEQIRYLHPGPRRRTGVDDLDDLAVAHDDARAGEIVAPPRHHGRHANRADARQRLAAKPESGDAQQVVDGSELAGGMASEGADGIVARHSLAVVDDGDQRGSGLLEVDQNARRAGVERILDQLLDHRGRSFDDFASSDLVGDDVGQNLDAATRSQPRRRLYHHRQPNAAMRRRLTPAAKHDKSARRVGRRACPAAHPRAP